MRAAFYECDVTPPLGGFMWGSYSKDERAYDVFERLYAKALVTECDGEIAAVVAVDTCAISPEMHDIVTKRIYEFTGITPDRVCINSGHTHRGAPVHDDMSVGCLADKTYQEVFYRLTADAVILAYKRLETVTVTFGKTEARGLSFNRNYVAKDGRVFTFAKDEDATPFAEIDPDVTVLTFLKDETPIGSVTCFACHQACTGHLPGYTGDYSSVLSKELKKEYGNDFVSLFLIGTCGDINHVDPHRKIKYDFFYYRELGQKLAGKVLEAMKAAEAVKGDLVRVAMESVRIEKRKEDLVSTRKRIEELLDTDAKLMRLRNLVYYNATNETDHMDLYVQAIRLGDVCLYALPGEIFVNWGFELKKRSSYEKMMVIENCNSYCGYVPTREAFGENCDLYETTLCHHSCLVPEAGQILIDKALELGQKL